MMHRIKAESGDGFVGYESVAEWTSENTPIPLYGFWNVAVGKKKAIGGFVLFGEAQGEAAGQIAKKILEGDTKGNLIPVTAEKGRLLFSKTQLEKWNISLPENIETKATLVD